MGQVLNEHVLLKTGYRPAGLVIPGCVASLMILFALLIIAIGSKNALEAGGHSLWQSLCTGLILLVLMAGAFLKIILDFLFGQAIVTNKRLVFKGPRDAFWSKIKLAELPLDQVHSCVFLDWDLRQVGYQRAVVVITSKSGQVNLIYNLANARRFTALVNSLLQNPEPDIAAAQALRLEDMPNSGL